MLTKKKKKNDFECIQALQNVKREAGYENPWDKDILCAASLEWEGKGNEKKLVWKCPTEIEILDESETPKSKTPKLESLSKLHLYNLL